jgi:exodeoxyribonuclease-3
MRIISFNANGIRSAAEKGFFRWLARQDADVVCVQEIKAQEEQLAERAFRPRGWHVSFRGAAHKKGYSGVAIYRGEPDSWHDSLGWAPFDDEGRYLEARYGDLSVVSLYLPSGSSGRSARLQVPRARVVRADPRQWLRAAAATCCAATGISRTADRSQELALEPEELGLPAGGARLARPRAARRRWLDSYRTLKPEGEDYTWWSNRGQARAKNVGWRIDYQLASPNLRPCLARVRDLSGALVLDHAPYIVDYEFATSGPGAAVKARSGARRVESRTACAPDRDHAARLRLGAAAGAVEQHGRGVVRRERPQHQDHRRAEAGRYRLRGEGLWAPSVDRYAWPWLTRRRGWALATQVAMAGVLCAMAQAPPDTALWHLAALRRARVSVATQDIAIDAYRADQLLPAERGLGAALGSARTGSRCWRRRTGARAGRRNGLPSVLRLMALLLLGVGALGVFVGREREVAPPPPRLCERVRRSAAGVPEAPHGAVDALIVATSSPMRSR